MHVRDLCRSQPKRSGTRSPQTCHACPTAIMPRTACCSQEMRTWYAEDMWQYLSELGVHQREVHFKLGKVEDEIKTLVQKK